MTNIKKLKRTLGVLLAFAFAGSLVNLASAWGPERPTYTNETPASYATFNSITNNAAVGDERNFVRVGEVGSDAPYVDELEIVPGKEYEVYIYYHNNAASNTNESGYGMATNVKVASAYPTSLSAGERGMISGIISWSYVTPENPNQAQEGKVWDEAYLTTQSEGVVLRYKTGTAIIHNAGEANGSVLPMNLFTEAGTPIGFNKLTGNLPGCAEYSGYITYTLVAEKTDVSLNKQVSTDGENWAEDVKVKPGDYVTYKVEFKNIGNTNLTNVIFKDTHDDGLTLRTGSVVVYDVDNVDGKEIDDILDLSGYNMGDAAAGSLKQIIYQAQVSTDKAYCGKTLSNLITANYNSTESRSDDATVTVSCDEIPVEEKNCKTNPEMEGCQELPSTGPAEIILAIVVVAGICGGGYYLYRSRKTLKTVEGVVKGDDAIKSQDAVDEKITGENQKSDTDKKIPEGKQ